MPSEVLVKEQVTSVTLYDYSERVIATYPVGCPRGLDAAKALCKAWNHNCIAIPRSTVGIVNPSALYNQIQSSMVKGLPCHVISDGCRRKFKLDDDFHKSQSTWVHTEDSYKAKEWEESLHVKYADVEYLDYQTKTKRTSKLEFEQDNHFGVVSQSILYEVCGFKESHVLYTGGRVAHLSTHDFFGTDARCDELLWTLSPGSEARHLQHEAEEAAADAARERAQATKEHQKAIKKGVQAADKLATARTDSDVGRALELEADAVKHEITADAKRKQAKVDDELADQQLVLKEHAEMDECAGAALVSPDMDAGNWARRNWVKILLIALGVLLLLFILGGIFAYSRRNRQPEVVVQPVQYTM